MTEVLPGILSASWAMLTAMAPFLLLGFLAAGVLSVFLSPSWVQRHLGTHGIANIFKASFFGVPLPLCSCGVLPVAASLRKQGAGRGATTAFLLSTPQTGIDSLAITWALLGPAMALIRPVAAFLSGILGGLVVSATEDDQPEDDGPDAHEPLPACSISSTPVHRKRRPSVFPRLVLRAFHHGFLTLPRDIGKPLVLGILLSGTIAVFIKPEMLRAVGADGAGAYILAMLIGIPLYVCATASTPIAAGLIAAGLSPGAALVFLISGPATNAAALTTLAKILGRRALGLYLATVAFTSLGTGIFVDSFLAGMIGRIPAEARLGQTVAVSRIGFGEISAFLLLVILAAAILPRPGLRFLRPSPPLEEIHLRISRLSCKGCLDRIRKQLEGFEGVETTDIRLKNGLAIVRGMQLDPPGIVAAIRDLGYGCELIDQ